MSTKPLHYTAFAETADGGNPAGVVLDASTLDDAAMQAIAAELGYPESAFIRSAAAPVSAGEAAEVQLRYFTPDGEIPFCGHATIATAVALFEDRSWERLNFSTPAGPVPIDVRVGLDGAPLARFVSVEPATRELGPGVLDELLDVLGLRRSDLAPGFPVLESFAGNWHPVLVLAQREVFHQFRFDPRTLSPLLERQGWNGTVTVLSPLAEDLFEARNLFPVARITEDPATGSAAASTGAYLRAIGRVPASGHVEILQGAHVGRPSRLLVDIPAAGGIAVSGGAKRFTP